MGHRRGSIYAAKLIVCIAARAIQIDKAAQELIHLRDEIAAEKDGIPPKTLIVLCALTNAAYQRPDGGYVVPITALKD